MILIDKDIERLLQQEPFGVLCLQDEGVPSGYLMALAYTPDLGSLFLATSSWSGKYRTLCRQPAVALVVDNRDLYPGDLLQVSVVTACGEARLLPGDSIDDRQARKLLSGRHPQIKGFIEDSQTALFQVKVERYILVNRFQEVREWQPQGRSGDGPGRAE